MSTALALLTTVLGPAVVAALVSFVLNRRHDRATKREKRRHAAQVVAKEIEINLEVMPTFIESLATLRQRIADDPHYVPLIPIDRAATLLFEELKEQVLQFDTDTLLAVVAYVKRDRALNLMLAEMTSPAYGDALRERRQEILAGTERIAREAALAGREAQRRLEAYAETLRRRSALRITTGNDRADHAGSPFGPSK
jgi:hypothetical protein